MKQIKVDPTTDYIKAYEIINAFMQNQTWNNLQKMVDRLLEAGIIKLEEEN